ncbi:phosphopyruvate hydratase [Candidatus Micrarchaeota archaeon]|nr:phosphopyruvate hydratase [Candidatus Micrarchaeota archaeon]
MIITKTKARQVLDSRGNPTVEVEINGFTAIAPSGASTGLLEVKELRDERKSFGGKSVYKAVENALRAGFLAEGKNFPSLDSFDRFLKELNEKKTLGGNTTIALSMAFCKAYASNQGVSLSEFIAHNSFGAQRLPCPAANLINGGMHADNGLSVQEHMVLPLKTKSFSEAVQCVVETRMELKKMLEKKKLSTLVGDEGGFAPKIKTTREALSLIQKSLEKTGWEDKAFLGLDCAASSFYKKGKYVFQGKKLSKDGLLKELLKLAKEFNLKYVEDPFFEKDFSAYKELNQETMVVGDDLTVTNSELIEKAVGSISGVIIKPNQIGYVSDAIKAGKTARKNNITLTTSHRSGDSEDSFISDFATGVKAELFKLGAPCRGERTSKYNELLRIEERGTPYFHY